MSIANVFMSMFGNLAGSPGIIFALFAVIGVLLGYGIYQLLCLIGWVS